MAVNLIDKIVPKNDGFLGLVDAKQVIGGGVSGVIPTTAVPALGDLGAEATANKENTTIDTSTTKYPTVNLLKTGLDAKVIAPANNTADYLPQWNGTDSKTLKDGLAVPAGGLAGITALNGKEATIADGTANQVWHGNKVFSAVVESNISLTAGNTTNDAVVGTHGFLPALSGVVTQFLRGDGAYAAPASVTVPYGYISESFAYTANAAHNIVHNFGTYPVVQAFDTSGYQLIPLIIQNINTNTVAITFSDSATYALVLTAGSPPLTNYVSVSSDYSVLSGDYLVKVTAAGKFITLPTAIGRSGKVFIVKNASAGIIDVIFTSGQNADGYTDVTIASGDAYSFMADNTNYLIF